MEKAKLRLAPGRHEEDEVQPGAIPGPGHHPQDENNKAVSKNKERREQRRSNNQSSLREEEKQTDDEVQRGAIPTSHHQEDEKNKVSKNKERREQRRSNNQQSDVRSSLREEETQDEAEYLTDDELQPGAVSVSGIATAQTPTLMQNADEDQPEITINDDSNSALAIHAKLVDDEEDEEAIEARLQARISDVTEEIKQNLLQEAVKADIVDGNNTRPYKKLLFGMLLLVVTVVVVAVVISSGDKDSSGEPFPTQAPTRPQTRFEMMQHLVGRFYPTSQALDIHLSDMAAPQYAALDWLANEDEPTMLPPLLDMMKGDVDSQALIERYTLALLWFATTNNTTQWRYSLGFLGTNFTVCAWNSLQVDWEQEQVVEGNGETTDGEEPEENGLSTWGINDCDSDGFVTNIDLSFNNLIGTVPWEVSLLTNLHHLNLGNNRLRGTIPEELGRLRQLENLALATNEMTGPLPDSLVDIAGLSTLLLQQNSFTGTIPPRYLGWTQLSRLLLANNELNGTIPEFQPHIAISEIILDFNHLVGTIPESIASLNDLEVLSLYSNQLTGAIHPKLGDLENLRLLDLEDNLMSGTIPKALGNARDLENLRLGGNLLHGTLASELGLLKRLVYLSLFDNFLTGPLPAEIFDASMSELIYVSLENNTFVGTIPPEVVELSSLNFFHIQNNSFYGDLDSLICNETSGIVVRDARADCGGMSPELTCSCCTECCNDISGCTQDLGLASCERDRSLISEDLCKCSSDDQNGAVMTCTFPMCQHCNTAGTACALGTTGFFFDASGNHAGSFDRYEYITGEYENHVVTYLYTNNGDGREYSCEVDVDGTTCDYCQNVVCSDGFSVTEMECRNVDEDALVYPCYSEAILALSNGEEYGGILQVFHDKNFEGCIWYQPGICENFVPIIEGFYEGYACSCGADGLWVECHQLACKYCQNSTNPSQDGEEECFLFGHTFGLEVFDIVMEIFSMHYIDGHNNNTIVTSALTSDGSCHVTVDGQTCNSCVQSACPLDPSITGYQVECQNIEPFLRYDECKTPQDTEGVLRALRSSFECIPYNVTETEFVN